LAIAAAIKENTELTVYGDDYATEDGTCIRDYIHVLDLAEAHLAALGFLSNAPSSFSAFNVGTGHGYSVKEIITEVERISGRLVKRHVGQRRPGDPDRLVANCDRIKNALAWEPRHSSLSHIIQTATQWHRSRLALRQ
jgi:UDP-glucose 4-epimerase